MRIPSNIRPIVPTQQTVPTQAPRPAQGQDQVDTGSVPSLIVRAQTGLQHAVRAVHTTPVMGLHQGSVDELMHALQHSTGQAQRGHVAGSLSALVGPHSDLVTGLQHLLSPGTPQRAPLTDSQKSLVREAITALCSRAPLTVTDLSTIRSAVELGREHLAAPTLLQAGNAQRGALGRASTLAVHLGLRGNRAG